jgi:Na+/H+-dicarboxylate symporter
MKPWNMNIGMAIGLTVGALLWWSSYVPGAGMFQNMQLLIVPIAMAIVIVSIRNKRRKVGPYDPDTVARNKRGVL